MKKKIIGCTIISFVLISLAIALPIIFLAKPDNQTAPENPTINNTSSYTTTYPDATSTYVIPSFSSNLPTSTTPCVASMPSPTSDHEYKKSWRHWW